MARPAGVDIEKLPLVDYVCIVWLGGCSSTFKARQTSRRVLCETCAQKKIRAHTFGRGEDHEPTNIRTS